MSSLLGKRWPTFRTRTASHGFGPWRLSRHCDRLRDGNRTRDATDWADSGPRRPVRRRRIRIVDDGGPGSAQVGEGAAVDRCQCHATPWQESPSAAVSMVRTEPNLIPPQQMSFGGQVGTATGIVGGGGRPYRRGGKPRPFRGVRRTDTSAWRRFERWCTAPSARRCHRMR